MTSLAEEHPGTELDKVYDFRGAGEMINFVERNLTLDENEPYAEHPDLTPLECPDCVDENLNDTEVEIAYFADEITSFKHNYDVQIIGYWEAFCRDHGNEFMRYRDSWYVSE